ncbi:unnamed protein product [Trifolium pratense]|uniref:Uncharacterized protein n=1 Tax=Trifolium pratense TaxID=57577 RepID=A0ACB0J9S1_TRIPR|nr:unnamed protein product [Trifolium pratense]
MSCLRILQKIRWEKAEHLSIQTCWGKDAKLTQMNLLTHDMHDMSLFVGHIVGACNEMHEVECMTSACDDYWDA